MQRGPQLLFQPRRDGVAAAGQRPDHEPVGGLQVRDHGADDMAEPTGHPMPFYRAANGFRDHKSDLRTVGGIVVGAAGMHDEVGLHRPHPLVDSGTELRRPRYPVPRRKHRARPCVESRSQRTAALATPIGHDGPAGPGPHPQPEPVYPRPAPVVGLKGPLALGHGCLSSLRMASASHARSWPVGTRSPLVSSSVSLASRRGLQKNLVAAVSPRSGDCSRVLTRFRWVKPRPALAEWFTAVTAVTILESPARNPRRMLQNGWHFEIKLLASGNAVSMRNGEQTTKRGCPLGREPAERTTAL